MKTRKRTRVLTVLLASVLLLASLSLPVSAEAIEDLAIMVKMRETVSGCSDYYDHRYYTFTLKETSRVYVKVTQESSYGGVTVFNTNNKYYVYGRLCAFYV